VSNARLNYNLCVITLLGFIYGRVGGGNKRKQTIKKPANVLTIVFINKNQRYKRQPAAAGLGTMTHRMHFVLFNINLFNRTSYILYA